jgi:quercetin dioxygenase-like cupin family protein
LRLKKRASLRAKFKVCRVVARLVCLNQLSTTNQEIEMPLCRPNGIPKLARVLLACAASLVITATTSVTAQESEPARSAPRELFSTPLPDVPGNHLEVVELAYPPNPGPPSTPENSSQGHHHPGSVYVYVTQGAIRIGVEGQPVAVVKAGESFFEPPRAHHMFTESASATEGARAIAVMIVPDGEPSVVRGRFE